MADGKARKKKLIVTADDFGKTSAVNEAVIAAHDRGILTSTSLMVTGEACAEAVELAKHRPRLAVGLHLVLICGRAALPAADVPHLVDKHGNFSNDTFAAGVKYYFSAAARRELRREIFAQFEAFAATGLPFSHVDGHLHMHMHPTAFAVLVEAAHEYGVKHIRLPREGLLDTLRLRRTDIGRKLLWWSVFGLLSKYAARLMRDGGFRTPERVYGLLESGAMTEDYWLGLLPRLRSETNEIYCHPETGHRTTDNPFGERELAALLSDKIRQALAEHDFDLSTYADLAA